MTNPSSPQERAAAYALDILEEQAAFERELAAAELLTTEVAAFQAAAQDLAYGVPLAPLPQDLQGRLFDRLDRLAARPDHLTDLLEWSVADLEQVARDLPDWSAFPLPIGSERVIWQVDEAQAQIAFFLRIPTAGTLPRHWHATGESILVLAGNFIDDDGTVFEVGDRFVAQANTIHQPTTSMGCLILGITSIHDTIA
jgi:ChrR Cupin-like domain